jgi:hypothetical protein
MRSVYTFLFAALAINFQGSYAQTPAQMGLINPVAIGIRVCPDGGGLTAKFFLDRNLVVETQISGSQGYYHRPDNGPAYGPSWSATALMEYHIIFRDPSWRVYFGAGLHMGKWDEYDHALYDDAPRPEGIFGADGILGVEYLLRPVPIGISADAKPALNLVNDPGFFPNNIFGVSLRYYFGRKVVVRVEDEQEVEKPVEIQEHPPVLK